MTSIPVFVPLLNANEPEANLVEIHVPDGSLVKKDDLIFTIETTKAAADIESPVSGYFRLVARHGDTLAVGALLAYISATPDEPVDFPDIEPRDPNSTSTGGESVLKPFAELRMTKPARALAESLGVDFSTLPHDQMITESTIKRLALRSVEPGLKPKNSKMIIYGAGGHAKAIMEMVGFLGTHIIEGIIDDNPSLTGTSVLGIPVLGTREILPRLIDDGISLAANGVGGIINISIRVTLFELLERTGFSFPALCHPRSMVEASASVFDGVQVFANAYVGSSAVLHEKCMVNTGAIVSHDCEIGMYTHIAPGAMLAGHVHVGEKVLVGMGVTTAIGIKIGNGARIGNGAILLADVPERAIVPAGKVWSIN